MNAGPAAKRMMSEMISEMASNFISIGKTPEEKQNRLAAVCSAWNMALVSPKRRRRQLDQYIVEYRRFNPAVPPNDLAAIRVFGHAHGGTINDVLLAAVAKALRTLLATRGEQLDQVTITVPVAARRPANGGDLGNQIGIMPVTVPAAGDFGTCVTRTAEVTRKGKSHTRGASAALFVPAFLLLARTGLLHWFVTHQHAVQTFVTNLRGPEEPLTFGAAAVRAIIPIPSTTGNVTVTFAAASYAGTLRITILSDPDRMPDASALATALSHELSASLPSLPAPFRDRRTHLRALLLTLAEQSRTLALSESSALYRDWRSENVARDRRSWPGRHRHR